MTGRLAGEQGESLVEVVAAVAVLGIAATSLVLGLGAATSMSGADRRQAETLVVLSRAAEAVKDHRDGAVTCASASVATYAPAVASLDDLPPGWSTDDIRITGVACVPGPGASAPRVTIEATAPGGEPRALTVVPRV